VVSVWSLKWATMTWIWVFAQVGEAATTAAKAEMPSHENNRILLMSFPPLLG
jgi:hypothetical protein